MQIAALTINKERVSLVPSPGIHQETNAFTAGINTEQLSVNLFGGRVIFEDTLTRYQGSVVSWSFLDVPVRYRHARVAELADAPDLGSGGATRGGSSPPFRTSSLDQNPKATRVAKRGGKQHSFSIRARATPSRVLNR